MTASYKFKMTVPGVCRLLTISLLRNCYTPSLVGTNDFEDKDCNDLWKIGIDVKARDSKACHRIYSNKETIVKFSIKNPWMYGVWFCWRHNYFLK